jgi:hypothetical protein
MPICCTSCARSSPRAKARASCQVESQESASLPSPQIPSAGARTGVLQQNRREAVVTDRIRGRDSWADSTRTGVSSGKPGVRAKADGRATLGAEVRAALACTGSRSAISFLYCNPRGTEPPRVSRRLFRLSHAAMAVALSWYSSAPRLRLAGCCRSAPAAGDY